MVGAISHLVLMEIKELSRKPQVSNERWTAA